MRVTRLVIPLLVQGSGQVTCFYHSSCSCSPWLRSSDVTFTATLPRMLPQHAAAASVCSARAGFIRSPSNSSFIPPATPNIPTARRPYAPLPKSSRAAACLRGGSRVLLAHGIRVAMG
ncbi:hypothetical protein C8Q70DRAFT_361538 [Cubamyces menziesii]|nr:hypothetical protein C8Q70DRAFT_361538 [Cubamyces menziesii]